MNAAYVSLKLVKDEDVCAPGTIPIAEMLIMLELLTFFLYVCATPLFMCHYKVLHYESAEERDHREGIVEKINVLESKHRLDFYDYCLESIKTFSISFMEVICTLAVIIYQSI